MVTVITGKDEGFLSVAGGHIRYTTTGSAANPAVILVHGWLSHSGVWSQTVDLLRDHYYCVTIDLLGFGGSEKPTNADYSIPAQARRVLALADALNLDRFTLMGHSMGGQISLYIAAVLAPERVTRLVDVSGVVSGRLQPRVERLVYPMIRLGYHLPMLWVFMRRVLMRSALFIRWNFSPWFYDMRQLPLADWQIDREMSVQPGIATPAHRAGQAIHAMDLRPHLSKITAPTLVIFGTEDGTVPPTDGDLVAQHVAHSKLKQFDRCGHFPMYECKTRFINAVRTFMVEAQMPAAVDRI